jgi:hypothetical protein
MKLDLRVTFVAKARLLALALALAFNPAPAFASDADAPAKKFHDTVRPVLVEYCFDCHGEGMEKGKVTLDQFKSDDELVNNRELWAKVLKNVRAGLMPPEKKPRPDAPQQKILTDWIKFDIFGINPNDPDPGQITIRRLNRIEYRNTIRDLMGHDFNTDEELPPDDTGYGFDNIGDVLTVSPLLLEKYMQAAEKIVATAVPRESWMVQEKTIPGRSFRVAKGDERKKGQEDRFSFYEAATAATSFKADKKGDYRLLLEVEVAGQFDFDPGRCRVAFKADDQELLTREFSWQNGKRFTLESTQKWTPAERRLSLEIEPLTPVDQKKNTLDLRILSLRVQGPLDKASWVRPKNWDRFFTKDTPKSASARRSYAREVLARFATKAYRRPVDDRTVDRLVKLAESAYNEPGKKFEDGIAHAMIPVLASPRFLFRLEETTDSSAPYAPVDEYALATRLSYFVWSTMPDDELFRLAEKRELRKNLPAQMKRMLADSRSQELIRNFVGQWLQTRDVEGIDINPRLVLARDAGEERELDKLREEFRRLRNREANDKLTPEQVEQREKLREKFGRFFRSRIEFDGPLRRAMRDETEQYFAYVLHEDRSVLELIDSDYTFLNERLAKHYGITNITVTGPEMRRVELPEDSPRGGVLTHGGPLVVTSNPTRTSPVKRGLFILDNILGIPPPPPPPDVPLLEESEKQLKDRESGHEPTLREALALHREKPLCSSCHNRMDPLGFALENFNALGMWRDKERGQSIDVSGKLITGEPFHDIRELKKVLATKHRQDFYRCLAEKMLTYALGRGVEYSDAHMVDQIVDRLEKENGRCSALLQGVIESNAFQKRRNNLEPKVEQRVELGKP